MTDEKKPVFVMSAYDLPADPNDPDGPTWREANAEKTHQIPVGTFVELQSGARAWVVHHGRDCDQTPLYYVSLNKDDTEPFNPIFRNGSWDGGWSEESLKVLPDPNSGKTDWEAAFKELRSLAIAVSQGPTPIDIEVDIRTMVKAHTK